MKIIASVNCNQCGNTIDVELKDLASLGSCEKCGADLQKNGTGTVIVK